MAAAGGGAYYLPADEPGRGESSSMLHVATPDAQARAEPVGGEDERLARRANALTTDLMVPQARLYWTDLAITALVTWAMLGVAVEAGWAGAGIAAAAVGVLALYRGLSFIHELAHLRPGQLPGFRFAWNVVLGVPFLAPSFFYEGVHILHHAKDRYGTARDPEYLALSRGAPGRIVAFVAVALLAPVGLVLRFAVLTPLSLLIPPLRRVVVARMSAMTINPDFVREDVDRAMGAAWRAQEIACWLWSWAVIGLVVAGVVPAAYPLTGLAILAAATLVNQLRTAVAHAWTNDGSKMSFMGQFADSVNVPPPALPPALWAPVGLRYHALHHLLPRLPYHNLGEAHRRLAAELPAGSAYHAVARRGLIEALGGLWARASAFRYQGD